MIPRFPTALLALVAASVSLTGVSAAAVDALTPTATSTTTTNAAQMDSVWAGRAAEAAAAFHTAFVFPGGNDVLAATANSTTQAQYWNAAMVLNVLVDSGAYPGDIGRFYDLFESSIGWSRDFYDDMNWMALALLYADSAGPANASYVATAVALFDKIMGAWDTTCCGAVKGGVWWDTQHTQKATASNFGPVITAVQLFQRTSNTTYLAFAKQVYMFWWATMANATSGQIADHISAPGGDLVWWSFTYNQGLAIGASLAMYDSLQDGSYLANAQLAAGYMATGQSVAPPGGGGPVLTDGPAARCGDATCAQFKGIGFRYLAQLCARVPTVAACNVLAGSVTALWDLARDPANDMVGPDWLGPPPAAPTTVNVGQETSAVMALLIFAKQAAVAV